MVMVGGWHLSPTSVSEHQTVLKPPTHHQPARFPILSPPPPPSPPPGTALEQSEGAAQQLVFVLFNVAVLSFWGALLGLPVTSNALITAALHVLGRLDPMRDVNWMFSIKVRCAGVVL